MSSIQQIVDAFVRLGSLQSLEDLLAHRQDLAANMTGATDYDFSMLLGELKNEIAVIQGGLDKLQRVGSASEAGSANEAEPSE
ncbi:MAG: hypothetical protein JWL86_3542 [Rhizobium sp.]|nr:hypothetical protein [Rhizobium sp.]